MSNQDVLDAGQPPSPATITTDASGNPTVTIASEDSEEYKASLRHANALAAVPGTTEAPTGWGTYLRRCGVVQTGVAVSGDQCIVGPGTVLNVQATAGSATGAKDPIFVGSPIVNQVLLEPLSDGTVRLTFRNGDAITECAVYILTVSTELIAVLDAAADPPE